MKENEPQVNRNVAAMLQKYTKSMKKIKITHSAAAAGARKRKYKLT